MGATSGVLVVPRRAPVKLGDGFLHASREPSVSSVLTGCFFQRRVPHASQSRRTAELALLPLSAL